MASKTFGWHGVEFEAPQDWELAVDKGIFDKGFMRIDDSFSPRMGLKWETFKVDKVKPLKDMLKGLKDQMRKKDKNVRFLRETGTKIGGHPARFFHWRSIGEGYDAFWYCPKTNRAFAAEFYFSSAEYLKVKPAVDKVFESLACHRDGGVQRWTVFGLDLQVPSDYKLVERGFYATRLHLVFQAKETTFMIDRASFAQTLIGEKFKDLREWFEKDYRKELRKKYRQVKYGTPRRGETLGHMGIVVPGSYKLGTFLRKGHRVETRIWTCDSEDKIFAITTIRKEDSESKTLRALSTIMASVKCHKKQADELETEEETSQLKKVVEEAPSRMLDELTVKNEDQNE